MTEFFDVVDEAGQPTGKVISRDEAHQKGTLHRTAHVWLVKKKPEGYDILLQKRSEDKDSFPGMYDTSSAGHIPAGDEPLPSALRELKEELGINSVPVGSEEILEMYPLDFEEFLWANGLNPEVIEALRLFYKEEAPVPAGMHIALKNYLTLYVAIGGLPAPINAFLAK